MITNLKKRLEDSLRIYSVDIEYWQPGMGDSSFLEPREFLEAHLAALSTSQQADLQAIDAALLARTEQQYDDEMDDDVRILRMTAQVVRKSKLTALITF